MFNRFKINKIKAFTLMESIITLLIIGMFMIISINTLKKRDYTSQNLETHARKILYDLESATEQIILYDSKNYNLTELVDPDNSLSTFSIMDGNTIIPKITKLYQKYLKTTSLKSSLYNDPTKNANGFKIKSGAYIELYCDNKAVSLEQIIAPGDDLTLRRSGINGCRIFFDINDEKEPNIFGRDKFNVLLQKDGIILDH